MLRSLLKTHPELAGATERISRKVLGSVSIATIAKAVSKSLKVVDDIDNLTGAAGPARGGYVEPGQAAVNLCEEALDPFMNDMKRRLKMGDLQGASILCQGIVLGLYQVKDLAGGVIEYAGEDCLEEEAAYAMETFFEIVKKKQRKGGQKPKPISETFLTEKAPAWADLIKEALAGQKEKAAP